MSSTPAAGRASGSRPQPASRPRTPRPISRLRISWGRAIVALVSLAVFVTSGISWAFYNDFTSDVAHGSAVPGGKDIDGSAQNILLVGSDSRAGATPAELQQLSTADDGGSANTDTMMVMHLPAGGGKPTVISFPRDSWVNIPGYGMNKMNAAYPFAYNAAIKNGDSENNAEAAGLLETIKTIEALTGLHIDHYVQINLLAFYRISLAIGGVQVCLLHAENPSVDSDAYGSGYSGINLPAGVSTIEGKQALAFVRQRHGLPNGDLDRIRRQQYFLAAAFKKISSGGILLNPVKLSSLLSAVSSSLLTDPALNMLDLAKQMASLAGGNIAFETIPNNGPATIYPDGVDTSIVQVDTAAIPGFIAELDGKAEAAYTKAKAAKPGDVTLVVQNATDVKGLAADNAKVLTQRGFHVSGVTSAPSDVATTAVLYPAGQEAAAKAVAQAAGVSATESSAVTQVTLQLGTDNHWLADRQTASTAPTSGSTSTGRASTTPAFDTPSAANGMGCIN